MEFYVNDVDHNGLEVQEPEYVHAVPFCIIGVLPPFEWSIESFSPFYVPLPKFDLSQEKTKLSTHKGGVHFYLFTSGLESAHSQFFTFRRPLVAVYGGDIR